MSRHRGTPAKARRRRAFRILAVLVAGSLALFGLPVNGLAQSGVAAPEAPGVASADYSLSVLPDGTVGVELTVRTPIGGGVTIRPPSGPVIWVSEPFEALSPGGDSSVTVSYEISPAWAAPGPAGAERPGLLDGGWSWTALSGLTGSIEGPVKMGPTRISVKDDGAVERAPRARAYLAGDPAAGSGLLVVGPPTGLRGWRLRQDGRQVDVYAAGDPNSATGDPDSATSGQDSATRYQVPPETVPRGVLELARLVQVYGLPWPDPMTFFNPAADPVGLATDYWRSALTWDLGPDETGWLDGIALYSLAAVLAGNDGEASEAYLRELARRPGASRVVDVATGLRERTRERVGLNDLLDYLSLYGAWERLDRAGLLRVSIGVTGRDMSGLFDSFGSEEPSAVPADFVLRESAALRQAAEEAAARSDEPYSQPTVRAPVRPSPLPLIPAGAAAPAKSTDKVVYLTFDDGPSVVTPLVLQTLEDFGVPATFFVIGQNVCRYPNLVRRMAEDGDAIGNHTYDHNQPTVYASPAAFLASVKKAETAIVSVIGAAPSIVRAPGGTAGHFTPEYFALLSERGYTIYNWDVSSADTDASKPGATVIAENVVSAVKAKKRAIVLMHDSYGHTATAEALPTIIQALQEAGYEFATLGPK